MIGHGVRPPRRRSVINGTACLAGTPLTSCAEMNFFGSRPSSRPGSRPASRRPSPLSSRSPSPHGQLYKHDSIQIRGNLYDVLKPRSEKEDDEELGKELHVVLRYNASFILSKEVLAEAIIASFRETMTVVTDPGDGQFREASSETEEIGALHWTLWRGKVLEAGKEYSFDIDGVLPRQSPRSWRTPSGRIDHSLTVSFHGLTDSGRMRRTRKTIEVWNPFSMDVDDPRPGLDFHAELDLEMVGSTVEIEKDLEAFVRYPDQCYKGIGRSFPCEVSFPTATQSQLNSITQVTIDVLQVVWFLRPTNVKEKPSLLAKDEYPVTATVTVQPSIEPQIASLPLLDPMVHGRFSSEHVRVRHLLQIVFHRRWKKKVEWTTDVEIFHRDIGWEARGVKGVIEAVRGQEGDYWQEGKNQLLPKDQRLPKGKSSEEKSLNEKVSEDTSLAQQTEKLQL